MADADRKFLFEYHHKGAWWCLDIYADNEADAREKVKAAGLSRYKGEVYATIPVHGKIVRFINWITGRRECN